MSNIANPSNPVKKEPLDPNRVKKSKDHSEKDRRISEEVQRLTDIFNEVSKDKSNLVQSTINDVAFMSVTMEDLRESINRNGTTDEYKNGANQFGTKSSPDAQLYLQFSQKLAQGMKILLDCLPKTDKGIEVADDMDLRSFAKRK